MEKTSKMITAAVVLVLCAVAVIGVGYAYIATTLNEGNNANSEFIVLSQDAYTFADDVELVTYDTVNTSAGTTYTVHDASAYDTVEGIEGYKLKEVGSTTIHAYQIGGTKEVRTCEIIATGFTFENNMGMFMIVENGSNTTIMKLTANNTFKAKSGTDFTADAKFTIAVDGTNNPTTPTDYSDEKYYADTTVTVYYGFSGDVPAPVASDPATSHPITSATLTFKVDTEAA